MMMKKALVVFSFVLVCLGADAQLGLPIYFEGPEEDTHWNHLANDRNAPEYLMLAENPDKSGINPSDCMKVSDGYS
jgi:hypothetical protein